MGKKCVVREGRFVDPCETLQKMIDVAQPNFSTAKGIYHSQRTNVETHQPSRSMIGARTKEFPKGGILFNFCPICGTDISAPFADPPAERAAQGRT